MLFADEFCILHLFFEDNAISNLHGWLLKQSLIISGFQKTPHVDRIRDKTYPFLSATNGIHERLSRKVSKYMLQLL